MLGLFSPQYSPCLFLCKFVIELEVALVLVVFLHVSHVGE